MIKNYKEKNFYYKLNEQLQMQDGNRSTVVQVLNYHI